jgi:hypothetical protein
MIQNSHFKNERTKPIYIKKNLDTSMNNNNEQYSFKQNFFDPTKNSPPNEFMIKLLMRMNIYNTKSYVDNNDDNLDKE